LILFCFILSGFHIEHGSDAHGQTEEERYPKGLFQESVAFQESDQFEHKRCFSPPAVYK